MALLAASDICKTYRIDRKDVPVLRGASLSVEPGESLAVVGVSGAGKSTLLHILGGLDKPDSGHVEFRGVDVYGSSVRTRSNMRARWIGMVFQSYHLLPEMTVFENVFLPSMAQGATSSSGGARLRAEELLEAVGLAHRMGHRPMELSGGEQQRVALARALMNQPMLLLADEPTGNLDEGTGGHVLSCLFELKRLRDCALVMVTHNEHVARACDRTVRLDQGVFVAD